jgi:hypothetical protein
VAGRRVTLLSDGANLVRFTYDRGRVRAPWFGRLSTGPGTGWDKSERDSEAMVADADGTMWVGFESPPAIFRYAPDGALQAHVWPPEMKPWPINGAMESLARLPDGRFVAIGERSVHGEPSLPALLYAGDPVRRSRPARFRYRPPAGTRPVDAAALPNGSLLVLNRRFRFPFAFSSELVQVPAGAIRPGATVRGTPVATLAAPLIHDNFEGLAVTREGANTIVWLVSDDNESWLQRTLLLRFRLDTREARRP